ncbi:MAG: DUF2167 domain-containing protein [Deltaproteobacteria bacterium]|nr:DUF2167 domain-containing protein [Myxococcales bacterium]MDP3215996.1 DUF2167 domain-containing protein [Deltaproteobacteria bacterium]
MKRSWVVVALVVSAALPASSAWAQDAGGAAVEAPAGMVVPLADGGTLTLDGEQAAQVRRLQELDDSLQYRTGEVPIGDNLATLRLGPEFRYLDPPQAARVLEAWGNPPGPATLGMVIPAATSPFADDGWGVVITHTSDGHVSDSDADEVNYDEVLTSMREDAARNSGERVRQGLPGYSLVGWAERPHYDRATHILYWAKDIDFHGPTHTLNYAMRFLGRTGVLEMNAVAPLPALPAMRTQMEALRRQVAFQQGSRYSDFVPSTDRVAAYGVGALVAGKVLAKVGFFKLLVGFLIAGKKLVAAAAVALFAGVRSLFGRKGAHDPTAGAPPPPAP